MTVYSLVFAGVGGQGVITAADLLARAAMASGLDLRMYGSYGMSQRGGSVSAQLRIGERVLNARIEKGGADLVLSLDLIEAVRWAPFLGGKGRLLSASALVPPAGKVVRDAAKYVEFLRGVPGAAILDAGKLAGSAGSRGVNAVLLGAASSLNGFPVGAAALEEALRAGSRKGSGPILEAFRRGAEALR